MAPVNQTSRPRRRLTHPVTPAIVIAGTALVVLAGQLTRDGPSVLAWVVVALSAGYAISGSV